MRSIGSVQSNSTIMDLDAEMAQAWSTVDLPAICRPLVDRDVFLERMPYAQLERSRIFPMSLDLGAHVLERIVDLDVTILLTQQTVSVGAPVSVVSHRMDRFDTGRIGLENRLRATAHIFVERENSLGDGMVAVRSVLLQESVDQPIYLYVEGLEHRRLPDVQEHFV